MKGVISLLALYFALILGHNEYLNEYFYPCSVLNTKYESNGNILNEILCEGEYVSDANMQFPHSQFNAKTLFSKLIINDANLTKLESDLDNFFFKEIIIQNNKHLEYIDFHSFNESDAELESIVIVNNPVLNNDDGGSGSLMHSINILNSSLKYSVLLRDNNLKIIPERSFGNLNEIKPKYSRIDLINNNISLIEKYAFFNLKNILYINISDDSVVTVRKSAFFNILNIDEINLSQNRIKNVESYAFNNLTNIGKIDLSHNLINNVKSYAFNKLTNVTLINLSHNAIEIIIDYMFNEVDGSIDLRFNKIQVIYEFAFNVFGKVITNNFHDKRFENIVINLSNTSLTSKSLKKNAFNVTNVSIDLQSNYLKFLPQEVFEPLFKERDNNTIVVRYNEFSCDCRMGWIKNLSRPLKYIKGMFCSNKKLYIHRLSDHELDICLL